MKRDPDAPRNGYTIQSYVEILLAYSNAGGRQMLQTDSKDLRVSKDARLRTYQRIIDKSSGQHAASRLRDLPSSQDQAIHKLQWTATLARSYCLAACRPERRT